MNPMLLAETAKVGSLGVAFIALCVACGVLCAAIAFRKDEAKKMKRQELLKGVAILRNNGLDILPQILEHVATGDDAGAELLVRRELHKLQDSEHLQHEFNKVFNHLVEFKSKDPAKRMPLLKQVLDEVNKHLEQKLVISKAPAAPPAATNAGATASVLG